MSTKVVEPLVLDKTVRDMKDTLNQIKATLDSKMFTPSIIYSGKEITRNGTYDASGDGADGFDHIIVNVSGGGEGDLIELNADHTGTYYPAEYDCDGFNKVVVNIPFTRNKEVTISEGTVAVIRPDSGDEAMQKVTVTVDMYEEDPKTLTLSQETQTITPGTGFTSMKEVTVKVPLEKVSDGTSSSGTVTTNGTYRLSSGKLGFEPFVVNVSTAPETEEGVLTIEGTKSGTLNPTAGKLFTKVSYTVETSTGTAKENGDVTPASGTFLEKVVVAVPNELEDVKDLTTGTANMITTNGTYNLSGSGGTNVIGFKDGFVVNVSGGTGEVGPKPDTIIENGTYKASDDSLDGYTQVVVDVPTSSGLDFSDAMMATMGTISVPVNWVIPSKVVDIIHDIKYYKHFDDPSKLETVTLAPGHPGIKSINLDAFSGFRNLRSLAFANGASIEQDAFSGTAITEIPSGFTCTITGPYVFQNCPNLVSADCSGFIFVGNCHNLFNEDNNLETIVGTFPTYSDGYKSRIFSGTFRGTKISSLTCGTTVNYLEGSCFERLSSGTFTCNQITNSLCCVKEKEFNGYYWTIDINGVSAKIFTSTEPSIGSSPPSYSLKTTLYRGTGITWPSSEMFMKYDSELGGWAIYHKEELENECPYTGEYSEETGLYKFSDGTHDIYVKVEPNIFGEIEVSEKPVLYNSDGTVYTEPTTLPKFFLKRADGVSSTVWKIYYKYVGDRRVENYVGEVMLGNDEGGQFSWCQCTQINLPNLVKVASNMFCGCGNVLEFNFPSVTRVAEYGFSLINAEAVIRIPKCQYIGSNAFTSGAVSHLYLNSVTKVTEIEDDTFEDRSMWGLEPIKVHLASNTWVNNFKGNPKWSDAVTTGKVELVVG